MVRKLSHLSEAQLVGLCALLLTIVATLSYQNSFQVPFLFDDMPSIVENPTIRRLWPPSAPLLPPPTGGITTAGRPLVNFSLALNFAIDGLQVRSYHIFNLALHVAAGLSLFGLIRRTLLLEPLRQRFGEQSTMLSLLIALLWISHPLNTESVTYIVQRAEILAGLFLLLTLYGFLRFITSGEKRWQIFSIFACFLSVASKEIGAMTLPLVLLYEWTFFSRNLGRALCQRWQTYALFACSWGLQILLILSTGNRGGTTGFAAQTPWWKYLLTQAWALTNYLKLSVWPDPLIFDYGIELITDPVELAAPFTLVVLLFGLTATAIRRRHPLGFVGGWFFLILAPSSSILPVLTQTIAEHRMYLPLIAVLACLVLCIYRWSGRASFLVSIPLIAIACIFTQLRNDDYRSGFAIWRDTLEKRPENSRAWKNLGAIIADQENYPAALALFNRARQLQPSDAEIYFNTAYTCAKLHRLADALRYYETAIKIRPGYFQAYNNLGNLVAAKGESGKAQVYFIKALEIKPDYADAHFNLGRQLKNEGREDEARKHLEKALQIDPDLLERRFP